MNKIIARHWELSRVFSGILFVYLLGYVIRWKLHFKRCPGGHVIIRQQPSTFTRVLLTAAREQLEVKCFLPKALGPVGLEERSTDSVPGTCKCIQIWVAEHRGIKG